MFTKEIIKQAQGVLAEMKKSGYIPAKSKTLWGTALKAVFAWSRLNKGIDGEVVSFSVIKKDGSQSKRNGACLKLKSGYSSLFLFFDADDNARFKSFRIWQVLDFDYQPTQIKSIKKAVAKAA